jgi:hypothetical protein
MAMLKVRKAIARVVAKLLDLLGLFTAMFMDILSLHRLNG